MWRTAVVVLAYAAITAVMVSPLVNYSGLGVASYPGDVRLIIWTLAWDNRAVLEGLPLFDANVFYPAARSLAYNEHLFGVSLFTLAPVPDPRATRGPATPDPYSVLSATDGSTRDARRAGR